MLNRFTRKRIGYKTCMVPLCRSTTVKTPNKIFIRLPKANSRRRLWFNLARRDLSHGIPTGAGLYFCEDHFDLPNDMENWMEYSIMKCSKRMKTDAVPHLFYCQPTWKRPSYVVRNTTIKRKEIIDALLSKSTTCEAATATIVSTGDEDDQLDDFKKSRDIKEEDRKAHEQESPPSLSLCSNIAEATKAIKIEEHSSDEEDASNGINGHSFYTQDEIHLYPQMIKTEIVEDLEAEDQDSAKDINEGFIKSEMDVGTEVLNLPTIPSEAAVLEYPEASTDILKHLQNRNNKSGDINHIKYAECI